MSDQLANGRRFRVLNVIDEFTKECLGQVIDTSIGGMRVAQHLTQMEDEWGKPEAIVCDNGREYTSKVMFPWALDNQLELGSTS